MFCIEIAGLPIGIHHRFAFLPAQCGAYLTCQPPRFTVCASDEAMVVAIGQAGQDLLACDRQMCGFWKGGYEEKTLSALRRAEQAYGTPPPQG